LPEFATEQKNPGNKKHVTRIFVKLPSDRLAEGITFVDTPGLGSLAVAGAEETIAYLPRCDLGIVLIDASAGLTPDDLIVVQALYQAGASAMILISKADLFSAPDREQMIAYVRAHLRSELRVEPSVHAVSVFGADAALCDAWFESELRPFLAHHHELAITSQKRKIGALSEAVIGALQRRLQVGSKAVSETSATLPEKATEALRNGDRILERAQGESFFLTRKIAKMTRPIIDIAAERIAAALAESEEVDAASIFSETITSLTAEPVAATLRSIEQTRSALGEAMQVAGSASEQGPPDELPKPAGMPMMDVNEISKRIMVEKPRVLSWLGKGMLTSHVQRKLETEYNRALLEFLSLYANRLRRWIEQSINALRNAFTEFADMHRAQLQAAQCDGSGDTAAVEKDLRVLRGWANVPQGVNRLTQKS
jgi:hypothetical protein